MDKLVGIYIIISPSAKIYVGQTVNFKRRLSEYKSLRCKSQIKLFNSLNKHGFDAHFFKMIEFCSVENLNEKERYWQEIYEAVSEWGLNLTLTGTDNRRRIWSEETRKKMSDARMGFKWSEEIKQKMSNARIGKPNGHLGRKRSEETKRKIGERHKGKITSEETKKKISESLKKKKN